MSGSTRGRQPQPRPLIVTLYGLYAREEGGWISVACLVRMLAVLGVDEAAVRSSISRLKRRGLLLSERVGGVAGYALSPQARAILDAGDRRIFERPSAALDDGWLLAVFSVPESERRRRHVLRSRLASLGFGTVAPGVWAAPAHLAGEVTEVLLFDGLTSYVDLFRADHLAFGDVGEHVRQWWDLGRIQSQYAEFIRVHAPLRARWRRRSTIPEQEAFRDYVSALTAWRRLPFLDPGLPSEVLPRGWPGHRAADLFEALRSLLAEPAHRYVDSLR
jgi:phenylacetic acid degradation operon negative regulatory protein